MSGTLYVQNPSQAAKAFGGGSAQAIVPKQRHLFLVRFYAHGAQAGADQGTLTAVTYIAKSVERPKINPKMEELHQYNKKRNVYTGFRYEPLRMQLYDDYQSAAMSTWQDYLTYYFGDFNAPVTDYQYDITASEFVNSSGTGFGFIAPGADGDSNWFFDRIEIYHFYHMLYDVYQLIHPRITAFDPDDLDYSNTDVATISLSVAYEDLRFVVQNSIASGDASGQSFPEFVAGATFDGNVINVPTTSMNPNDAAASFSPQSSSTDINNIFSSVPGPLSSVLDYRYGGSTTTGALSGFGNFAFGPTTQNSLTSLALNNPALAAALNLGVSVDPLTVTNNSLQGVVDTSSQGINGAAYDVAMGRAMAVTSGYGNATNAVTAALLASSALKGDASVVGPNGVTLPLESYGSLNAQQTGTAQYGVSTPSTDTAYGLDANAISALGVA